MSSPALLLPSPCNSPTMTSAYLTCRFGAGVFGMVADSFFVAAGSSVEKTMSSSGTAVARSAGGSPAVARAGLSPSHSAPSVVSRLLRADSEESSSHDDEDDYSDWDEESDDEVDAQQNAWDAIPEELQFCGLFCPMTNRLPTPASNKTVPKTSRDTKDYTSSEQQINSESNVVNGDRLLASCSDDETETVLDEDFLSSLLHVEGHNLLRRTEHNNNTASDDRLKSINAEWNFTYSCVHDRAGTCNCDRRDSPPRVRFSAPETWSRIAEDPAQSCDLREARRSDLMQRRADRERLERVLAPVLAPDHRRKVYQRIQQQQQKVAQEEAIACAASASSEASGQQDFTLSSTVAD